MRDLTEIRQQIDQIDQKMLALFKERMGCSVEVAEYKRGTGKAIYDPVRERQKIDALTKDEDELIIKKSVEEMFLQMMSISRRYQYSLLSQEDAYIDQTFEEVEALVSMKIPKLYIREFQGHIRNRQWYSILERMSRIFLYQNLKML